MENHLEELMRDSDFVQALLQCRTTQEAGALFMEHQVEVTLDQLRVIVDQLSVLLEEDGEMGDEALEHVAGGQAFAGLQLSAALRDQVRQNPPRWL